MQPSGVFFTNHAEENGYLVTRPQRIVFAGFLALLFVLPWLVDTYLLGVITLMLISLVAVYGLQITTGMAGQLNLGQSAFVGVGAFLTAKMSLLGLPFWAALPAAGIGAGLSSILFGLPAVRVKGFYLALTTFAAQIMFPIIIIRLPTSWLGGPNGLSVSSPSLFGFPLTTPTAMYFLCLVTALIASVFAFNLARSRMGRAFQALRDNDVAADILGISPLRYKVLAFFAGAFLAGLAGALYAYYVRYVTTEQFTLWQSIWYVGMLIVGGLYSPLGAILGTVFISTLQEVLHVFAGMLMALGLGLSGGFIFAATNVMLGAIIILALIFEPNGLAYRWSVIKASYRIWPYPHS